VSLERPSAINALSWLPLVTAAVGPMAKDVESLALCMRALLCEDMFNLDSTVPPLPFNEEVRDAGLWEELLFLRQSASGVPTYDVMWFGMMMSSGPCPASCVCCWLLPVFQAEIFLVLQVYSSTQPLRIGYYETDFFTMPSPAMRRAVRETKQLLEEAGHTVGCCMNPTVMLQLCFLLASGPRTDHKAHLSGKGPSICSTSHNISGWILGRFSFQEEW